MPPPIPFAPRNAQFVCDPAAFENALKPRSDGSIDVNVISVTASSKAPTFTPLSGGQMGLSVGAAAVGLTPPATATYAQITVSGANIRYRDDGVDPTAAVGMPVYQASSWLYAGNLSAIKFIAQSGTATLDVLYYK